MHLSELWKFNCKMCMQELTAEQALPPWTNRARKFALHAEKFDLRRICGRPVMPINQSYAAASSKTSSG